MGIIICVDSHTENPFKPKMCMQCGKLINMELNPKRSSTGYYWCNENCYKTYVGSPPPNYNQVVVQPKNSQVARG